MEISVGRWCFTEFGGLPVLLNPPLDGSCQFSAAADQLNRISHQSLTGDKCRKNALDWIIEHERTVHRFVSCSCSIVQEDCDTCWKQYISNLAKPTTFGDHLTLLALACVFNVQWVVLSSESSKHCLVSATAEYDPDLPLAIIGHQE